MKLSQFIVCAGSLLFIGCGTDTLSPPVVAGTYVFAGAVDSINLSLPLTTPPYPWLDLTSEIDSLKDVVVLNADGTYQETGGMWGYDSQESVGNLIDAHGTYTLSGPNYTTITLTAASGSNVSGGIGTIQHDTLAFPRYPGAWKLKKSS